MYRIYRKFPDPFQGDLEFCVKNRYILEELQSILWLISWSLPDDEGGITCMKFCIFQCIRSNRKPEKCHCIIL